jgi:formylglycine-generating enzyme
VLIPAPSGAAASSHCIDATEVTNSHYAEFLAAAVGTQSGPCSWNLTYTPSSGWPATGKESHPVVNVDWCDAFAYCSWAGKRLCGKIGGGSNAFANLADPTQSEWFNACSAGGLRNYPYGNTYDPLKCVGNGYDGTAGYQTGSDKMFPVQSAIGCQASGAYAGVYDLSGNAWEWEESCNGTAGANDQCRQRGGSFTNDGALVCDYADSDRRDYADGSISFRCCAKAL